MVASHHVAQIRQNFWKNLLDIENPIYPIIRNGNEFVIVRNRAIPSEGISVKAKHRRAVCAPSALAILSSFGATAYAQEQDTKIGEVVVTGVRQAMRDSIVIKRNSELVSDNISDVRYRPAARRDDRRRAESSPGRQYHARSRQFQPGGGPRTGAASRVRYWSTGAKWLPRNPRRICAGRSILPKCSQAPRCSRLRTQR